eukprot:118578-Chlamydomonas_euryale.AAC.1
MLFVAAGCARSAGVAVQVRRGYLQLVAERPDMPRRSPRRMKSVATFMPGQLRADGKGSCASGVQVPRHDIENERRGAGKEGPGPGSGRQEQ